MIERVQSRFAEKPDPGRRALVVAGAGLLTAAGAAWIRFGETRPFNDEEIYPGTFTVYPVNPADPSDVLRVRTTPRTSNFNGRFTTDNVVPHEELVVNGIPLSQIEHFNLQNPFKIPGDFATLPYDSRPGPTNYARENWLVVPMERIQGKKGKKIDMYIFAGQATAGVVLNNNDVDPVRVFLRNDPNTWFGTEWRSDSQGVRLKPQEIGRISNIVVKR